MEKILFCFLTIGALFTASCGKGEDKTPVNNGYKLSDKEYNLKVNFL